MKITGQLLKESRESKGISINEVAVATKINMRTLQALEAGDLETLPPKTFLRGFVKAYASFLELDVDSVLNTFFEEMGSTKPKSIPTESDPSYSAPVAPSTSAAASPVKKSGSREAHNAIHPKTSLAVKVSVVIGILCVVVLIVFVKKKMESYETETLIDGVPSGLTSINKDDTVKTGATPAPVIPLDGKSDTKPMAPVESSETSTKMPPVPPNKSVESNTKAVVVPPPTPAPTSTPQTSPQPTATPSPTPTATPNATPSPTPSPTPTPTPTPTPSTAAAAVVAPTPKPSPKPPGRAQDIIIEALDNVTVDAQIDDEATKKFQLKGEQVQSIKARRHVILRFTDGGAVNLIVNGVERGVPGDLGKPLRVELP